MSEVKKYKASNLLKKSSISVLKNARVYVIGTVEAGKMNWHLEKSAKLAQDAANDGCIVVRIYPAMKCGFCVLPKNTRKT